MTQESPPADLDPALLSTKIMVRRAELIGILDTPGLTPRSRTDIEAAIAAVGTLMTGDRTNIPDSVVGDLIRWLDTSTHLGQHAAPAPEELAPVQPDQ
jgi:hypothetical protein